MLTALVFVSSAFDSQRVGDKAARSADATPSKAIANGKKPHEPPASSPRSAHSLHTLGTLNSSLLVSANVCERKCESK
jgi:hypothetical protein